MSMTQDAPPFRILAFYSTHVESDHIHFAEEAVRFLSGLAIREGWAFEATPDWERMNEDELTFRDAVIWINHFPQNELQRRAFEGYMESGGRWLGFHVSGYNDRHTNWLWFVDFFGGAVFYSNNWPPLPAELVVDDRTHPTTQRLPEAYTAPADEWYMWKPSPRENPDVRVLVTLSPKNYPLGIKNKLIGGDIPVAWTNTKYRMIYVNMGHKEGVFGSEIQNRLFEDALHWLAQDTTENRENAE